MWNVNFFQKCSAVALIIAGSMLRIFCQNPYVIELPDHVRYIDLKVSFKSFSTDQSSYKAKQYTFVNPGARIAMHTMYSPYLTSAYEFQYK